MSTFRRSMMIKKSSGGGGLPEEYTQYDWIAAKSGYPTINTQFTMSLPQGTKQKRYTLEGIFARTSGTIGTWPYRYILGSATTQNNVMAIRGTDDGTLQCVYQGAYNYIGSISQFAQVGVWHTFKLTYRSDNVAGGNLILDETDNIFNCRDGYASEQSIYILGINANNTNYPCRFGRFRIYDYGNLVADMVPCMRNTDNVVGMYDLKRKLFLTPVASTAVLNCGNGFDDFSG